MLSPALSDNDEIPRLTPRRLLTVLGIFCGSRLLLMWAARAADQCILAKGPYYYGSSPSLVEMLFKWDSHWMLNIVDHGYSYHRGEMSNVGFYPLYPSLMWLVARVMPRNDGALAGYLISNVELALCCVALWKLAALEFRSVSVANRAVALLALCPGAVWFSMIYSESTFLLFLTLCVLWCRQRRWLLAGVAGYLVALSRTPGLLAGAFLGVEALSEWWERRRNSRTLGTANLETLPPLNPRQMLGRLLAVGAPALGIATYYGFLQVRFGDWRAQQRSLVGSWADTGWGAQRVMIEPALWWLVAPIVAAAVALLVLTPVALRRRWSYAALAFALLGLYWATTNPNRLPRYLSVVLPLFLSAAWLGEKSRALEVCLLAGSAALMMLLTALLVCGYSIN